jgi:hypothetical protein
VPPEDDFIGFLRWMGWTDWAVYERQPHDYAVTAYTVYRTRSQLGMLG